MSRLKRAAAVCVAAGSIIAAAAPADARPPDPRNNPCESTLNASECVNYSLDVASWSVDVGHHVVDEWVWNDDGTRSACETYVYVMTRVCPPQQWSPGA